MLLPLEKVEEMLLVYLALRELSAIAITIELRWYRVYNVLGFSKGFFYFNKEELL